MLTPYEEAYLLKVPENKTAHIVAFDPATQTTAREVIREIQEQLPTAEIHYIGSSKLGIAGENDIDLTVIAGESYKEGFQLFKDKYGEPVEGKPESRYLKWEFVRNSFPIELHLEETLTPSFQIQLDTMKILESNEDIRKEYEQMKLESKGIPSREYLRKKFEFWYKIRN